MANSALIHIQQVFMSLFCIHFEKEYSKKLQDICPTTVMSITNCQRQTCLFKQEPSLLRALNVHLMESTARTAG